LDRKEHGVYDPNRAVFNNERDPVSGRKAQRIAHVLRNGDLAFGRQFGSFDKGCGHSSVS
jgi:hypothetical protein